VFERLDSPKDAVFREVVALGQAAARAQAGAYVIEGEKLVRQAFAAGVLRQALVLDDEPDTSMLAELAAAHVPTWLVPAALGPKLIGTSYPTRLGAVGVATRRSLPSPPRGGLLLAAESVRDPRNVGVLVRTAEAAGAAALLLSDDSADPWSRPAVRSTTGSILRQPLYLAADLPATLSELRSAGMRVIATSARAETPAWDADLRGDVVLVVGSESEGLSAAARAQADLCVSLPTHGAASSLNVTVAAGALLYEALRQRRG
jgi:TrmH family RNA methyltransferase